jgi:hypothetical protein
MCMRASTRLLVANAWDSCPRITAKIGMAFHQDAWRTGPANDGEFFTAARDGRDARAGWGWSHVECGVGRVGLFARGSRDGLVRWLAGWVKLLLGLMGRLIRGINSIYIYICYSSYRLTDHPCVSPVCPRVSYVLCAPTLVGSRAPVLLSKPLSSTWFDRANEALIEPISSSPHNSAIFRFRSVILLFCQSFCYKRTKPFYLCEQVIFATFAQLFLWFFYSDSIIL